MQHFSAILTGLGYHPYGHVIFTCLLLFSPLNNVSNLSNAIPEPIFHVPNTLHSHYSYTIISRQKSPSFL